MPTEKPTPPPRIIVSNKLVTAYFGGVMFCFLAASALASADKECSTISGCCSRGKVSPAETVAAKSMAEADLFARGQSRVYSGESLGAVSLPIGGIGSGCILIDGKAIRHAWQIFGNFDYVEIPDSFFAVRTKTQNGNIVIRALQTEATGAFGAMSNLTFRGEYPFGWYAFEDSGLPVRVEMEAYNPMIPLNVKDSAIPCVIFNLIAENPGESSVEVSFLAAQQNAVGYMNGKDKPQGRSYTSYGQNINTIIRQDKSTLLHMATRKPADSPAYGDMVLIVLDDHATGTASWETYPSLFESYRSSGMPAGPEKTEPSENGTTWNGALASSFILGRGEKRTVTFALTWSFPNLAHGEQGWGGSGNYYNTWWADAMAVAQDVRERLDELTRQTRLYHDTLYASNLPYWLMDRLSSQIAILRTQTCFWTKEGYFGGYEGCCPNGGCCLGNCTHVWHYAQAHARLFPEIGRLMRQQDFANQDDNGGFLHRHVKKFAPAIDGHLGSILGAYREHLMSKNSEWLRTNWKYIRKAMEYTIGINDPDEDGMLSGMQWNTLDGSLGGSTSWIGSLYLAALSACGEMARLQNDNALADRYRRIFERGSVKQVATLFNGEYFIQIPDASLRKDYLGGCHIDQVLGQFWAGQLNLGWVYPPDKVRTVLQSLMQYNFHVRFRGFEQKPRKFVDDSDAGLQMITWPRGNKPPKDHAILYGDEVMSGFEYTAAAAMVQAGLLKEGFTVAKATANRYDGRLRTGLAESGHATWGYSGNPFGDDECGKFYARAMSVWGMLIACQGFIYDGPQKTIGFKPACRPDDHTSFFTAAEGWGLFQQLRNNNSQTDKIEVVYGELAVQKLIFELPDGAQEIKNISVMLDGAVIAINHKNTHAELQITFVESAVVSAKSLLEVRIEWY